MFAEFKPKQNQSSSIDIKDVKSLKSFKVEKVLGRGAFGIVSLGIYNGVNYAIKEIDKASVIELMLEGDEERYYVMRDREILVSEMVFDVPYCIKFFTHFEENGKEYFVYEIANGGDLTSLKNRQPKKRFTEVSARKYLHMIAISIAGMHKKRIVHRDIKPDNIMLSDNTENAVTKTADFGTARIVDQNNEFKPEKNETINQTVAGSGFYMSPEMRNE